MMASWYLQKSYAGADDSWCLMMILILMLMILQNLMIILLYFDRELQFDYFCSHWAITILSVSQAPCKPTCRKAQGLMRSVDDAKNSIQKATWESKERRWWTFRRKLPEEFEELPWSVYHGWLDDLMGFNDSSCCCCHIVVPGLMWGRWKDCSFLVLTFHTLP